MAKAKKSTSRLRNACAAGEVSAVPKTPEDLQSARNRVANVIVDASVEMTESIVRSVNERGSVLALRFLWEIAGMFPTPGVAPENEQESIARSLIKTLGLYEEYPDEYGGDHRGVGDVKSEES